MNEPTHLDLFSGIGGFSLAAERCGFKTIGFSEIDPYACAVLKKHWPGVKNYGDIRNLRGYLGREGPVDLLTGGFPCQPFSFAGKRRGKEDDRHLWPEMLAVIKKYGPAWIIGENVTGIVDMELDSVLDDLDALGYSSRPFIVSAASIDLQNMERHVWIVSTTNRDGCKTLLQEKISRLEVCERELSRSHPIVGDRWDFSRPRVCGVGKRIPAAAHRVKCLGNAINPGVAEIFLKEIYKQLTTPSHALTPTTPK